MRCSKKSSRCSLARFFRPLRVLRLAASATGGARLRTPYPSPAAGEGDSIYNLYIKMCRRHLESVSAAPYGRCQSIVCNQPQLSGKGVLGHSPKRILVWGPGGTRGPLGKGGAAERWRVTPSVSGVTRHGAQPATTRTYKSRAPAAIRTDRHLLVTPPRRRRPSFGLKTLFPTFLHRKASPAARRI